MHDDDDDDDDVGIDGSDDEEFIGADIDVNPMNWIAAAAQGALNAGLKKAGVTANSHKKASKAKEKEILRQQLAQAILQEQKKQEALRAAELNQARMEAAQEKMAAAKLAIKEGWKKFAIGAGGVLVMVGLVRAVVKK